MLIDLTGLVELGAGGRDKGKTAVLVQLEELVIRR